MIQTGRVPSQNVNPQSVNEPSHTLQQISDQQTSEFEQKFVRVTTTLMEITTQPILHHSWGEEPKSANEA